MLIIKKCHAYCRACTGPTNNVCSACEVPYYLSGTTCDTACLIGYGQNPPSRVCIACNQYCSNCLNNANNCLTCFSNVLGTPVYNVQGQNQCVIACSSPLLLHITTCMSTCPPGYGPDSTSTNCILCDTLCETCSGTSTNCQTCKVTTPITLLPIYYLDGQSSCITSCLDPYYITDVSGVNYCRLCDQYCLSCLTTATNCLTCYSNVLGNPVYNVQGQNQCVISCPSPLLLYITTCMNTCPPGYGPDITSTNCL